MDNVKTSSNKSFGIVFFIVFLLISFYPLIKSEGIIIWSLLISIIFLILGLINSNFLTPLNIIWTKFGFFLGNLISPIIMSIIFFCVITPIGFLMRIFGKDSLNLKKTKKETYWKEKEKVKSSMKNQF
mgnify:CR=1 FL=1|tara:strand:- start:5192 stop:5575 length:384 start_codon:yes stop_codon:yes gene_type:complete